MALLFAILFIFLELVSDSGKAKIAREHAAKMEEERRKKPIDSSDPDWWFFLDDQRRRSRRAGKFPR